MHTCYTILKRNVLLTASSLETWGPCEYLLGCLSLTLLLQSSKAKLRCLEQPAQRPILWVCEAVILGGCNVTLRSPLPPSIPNLHPWSLTKYFILLFQS